MVYIKIHMKLTEHQIAELAAIFDDVITSDSVAVQSAFQRLALLSSLARQEKEEPGPFSTLLKRLDWAETELKDLRREVQILQAVDGKFSFTGDPLTIDLSQNMNSSNTPYTYSSASTYSSGVDTITLSPLDLTDLNVTWIGNISISELNSATIK